MPHHSQLLHAHQSRFCLLAKGEDRGPKIENYETQTETSQPCQVALSLPQPACATKKVRDEAGRMIALRSAAPYALCTHNVEKFFGFPPEQKSAFAMGLAKTMQQGLHYGIYGQAMNHLSDKVFTPREVQPSGDVKVHLGLTGPNAGKSFMDM